MDIAGVLHQAQIRLGLIVPLEAEPRTHERYQASMKRFMTYLGDRADEDLNTLTVNQVLKYRDNLAKQLSPSSANLELKVLRACLYAAQKQDLVEKNVAAKVDTLKQRG